MIHIGIDFDDTLMDTRRSIVQLLNHKHNKSLKFEEIAEYGVSSLYNYSFKEFQAFFTNHLHELHTIKPEPFVKETLIALGGTHKCSVITGRPTEWMESASDWITSNDLSIQHIFCASDYTGGKAECAAFHEVTHFIEDRSNDAISLAENGIDVFLLDKPYNRECRHARITRVQDWQEIRTLIGGFV